MSPKGKEWPIWRKKKKPLEWPGKPQPEPVEPPRLCRPGMMIYQAMKRLGEAVTLAQIYKELIRHGREKKLDRYRWPTQTIYLNLRRGEDREPPIFRRVELVSDGGRGRPSWTWALVPREEYETTFREETE